MESKQILRGTIKDTIRVFGGLPWILTLLVLPWPGFAFHRFFAGVEPMREELTIWLTYSLAGTAALLVCIVLPVFLWRLWLAPYRILSQRLETAEAILSKQYALERQLLELSNAFSAVQEHVSQLPDGQGYHQTLNCLRETFLHPSSLGPLEQRISDLQSDAVGWQSTLQHHDQIIADIKAEVHELQSRSSSEGETQR